MQKEETHWWAAPLGAAIVAGITVSIALAAAGGWNWMSQFLAGAASNWAQAIGTVVAIYYSGRIARTQILAGRKWDEHRRIHSESQTLSTIVALLAVPISVCALFKKGWDPTTHQLPGGFSPAYWQEARTAIAAIDPFSCPDQELVVQLVQIPRQLDLLIVAFGDYQDAVKHDLGVADATAALQHELGEAIEYLQSTANIAAFGANERFAVLVKRSS